MAGASGTEAGKGKQLVTSNRLPVSIPTRHPVAGVGNRDVACLIMRITTSASTCTSLRRLAGPVPAVLMSVAMMGVVVGVSRCSVLPHRCKIGLEGRARGGVLRR